MKASPQSEHPPLPPLGFISNKKPRASQQHGEGQLFMVKTLFTIYKYIARQTFQKYLFFSQKLN